MIGISLGRFHLANQDLPGASAAFAQALALSPTNETANALYAATRLLVLPDEPAGSNFLTRVGFPTDGRNLYNWTARLPKDTNGILLAPTGVRAGDFTAQLRTNVLLSVTGAISNLAAITDTNFTLDLSSNETTLAEVTVDYGDLKLIQAALYGAQYLIYALNAQNLDAQLTDLRSLYTNGILSVGQVLADYPQLFTFATTNDLQAARAAFTNGVDAYLIASAFIRSRPTNIVRLFNYDRVSAQGEADFRFTLQDLRFSLLAGPQTLAIKPNLTVNMATQFTGGATWRSLLPRFDGNSIELGTFPDLTFGGGIDGLDQFHVEDFLSGYFKMLPVGGAPEISAGSGLNLAFTTLPWHYYALEASGNLVDWRVVAAFTATNFISTWMDSHTASKHFYRLRDDTGFYAFSGRVLDSNTGLPIAGAEIYSPYDGSTTFTDNNGLFYLKTSVPTSWYFWSGYQLGISAVGYAASEDYYYGSGLVSGLQIYLAP